MKRLFIFGLGYTAGFVSRLFASHGWEVVSTGSEGTLSFDDDANVRVALADADHVLSSVPPGKPGRGEPLDPVLDRYGDALGDTALSYLSSTGVYGDAGGAWVDEATPVGTGRRTARAEADGQWLLRGARIYRLPGIYGPGRSVLDRIRAGRAHRIDLPGQVFSRVHVEDIAAGILAGIAAPGGAYNLADDLPCSQNTLVEFGCGLIGHPVPPLQSLEDADLSPMARDFYAENRRVANGKARRVLGWRPRFATYREGLRALTAISNPTSASTAPLPANTVQR